MPEPIDVYADQFQINTGPFGSTLSFSVTSPVPPAPGQVPAAERLASIRMSNEHLKAMVFMLRRQILMSQRQMGVDIQVSQNVLNGLSIGPEDWERFWRE